MITLCRVPGPSGARRFHYPSVPLNFVTTPAEDRRLDWSDAFTGYRNPESGTATPASSSTVALTARTIHRSDARGQDHSAQASPEHHSLSDDEDISSRHQSERSMNDTNHNSINSQGVVVRYDSQTGHASPVQSLAQLSHNVHHASQNRKPSAVGGPRYSSFDPLKQAHAPGHTRKELSDKQVHGHSSPSRVGGPRYSSFNPLDKAGAQSSVSEAKSKSTSR